MAAKTVEMARIEVASKAFALEAAANAVGALHAVVVVVVGAQEHLRLQAVGDAEGPAHLHVRLEADGHEPLTTQVYFLGDPWLDHDVVGGARPSLTTKLEPAGGPDGAGFTCRFDFALAPVR